MFLIFSSLFTLVNARPSLMMDTSCYSFTNKNDCLDSWDCMWCNTTSENNSGICNKFNVCNYNSSNYENCETPNYFFNNECNFLTLLFYTFIFTSFFASVFLLIYTTKNLLSEQNTRVRVMNSIMYLILFLIVIPFIILFYFDNAIFYYYLISIIFLSLFYTCCFHTTNYTKKNYESWIIDFYKIHNPQDTHANNESEKLIN